MEDAVSVWNRIGDVATSVVKGIASIPINTGKFAIDIAYGAAGTAKMAYDIGTAPWNDDEEYNGFVKPFKSAWNENQKNVIRPLASAGGAIMKVPGVQPTFEKIAEITTRNSEMIYGV